MKKCSKCGETKNDSLFHKDKNRKDGLFPYCKDCRNYIPKKPRGGEFRKCIQCGKKVYLRKSRLDKFRFCSVSCLGKYYTSQPDFQKNIKRKYGADHHRYKGGSITEHGYRVICIEGNQIYEHRYVMEQNLGRKLTYNETVHHINGNKLDNNIKNLLLLERSKHTKMFHCGEKNKCIIAKKTPDGKILN